MKSVLSQVYNHLRLMPRDIKVISALMLSATLCAKNVYGFFAFSSAIGSSVQIFEPFIFIGTKIPYFLGVILGSMLLLSDAPFLTQVSKYEMIRMGRRKWVTAQITYLIVSCFLFELAILFFVMLFTLISHKVSFANLWSYAVEALADSSTYAVNRFKFSYSFPEFVRAVKPMKAVILTIIYNTFYMAIIGLAILSVNLFTNKNYGWILASIIHIAAYIFYANSSFGISPKWSLLCHASPAYHYIEQLGMSPLYSLILFLILVIALIKTCLKFAPDIELFN